MSLTVDLAVEAYKEVLRVERLLDKKRANLNHAVARLKNKGEVRVYMLKTVEVDKIQESLK